MDAVYMKAPHELAHFVMARVVNPMSKGTDAFLPYHNAETESAFKGAVIESIQMALKTVGVTLAAHVSTNEAQKLYCTNAAKIEAQEKELASKAYNSGNQKLFLSALTYAQELQTITFPACKELTRNFLQEMGVRVFEQVANGLASDIGAHPDELHYLQPLVNYTMAHLYPIFDQYIATNCATSTQYTCQMRDGELYSIKLLEVVKVHEDL